MDKKGLVTILIILIGGIFLSNYSKIMDASRNIQMAMPQVAMNTHPVAPIVSNAGKSSVKPQSSFSEVVKMVTPSLVNISAVHIVEVQTPFYRFYFGDPFEDFFDEFFGRRPRRQAPEPEKEKYRYEGTGSGFIVDTRGYVLTNYHVIKDATELKVRTYDDKTYDAEVMGKDPRTDLAVIKIKSSRKFNALKMGNSDAVEIGDWVLAAGSPFGLNQTFTAGIISAVRQNVQVENAVYRDMLQTDAAINRGNSGGPLVDLSGEVIGINTAIFAPTGVFSGIGFAIPINPAERILGELIEKGRVVRGWLGVEIKDVDEAIRQQFGLKAAQGVLVNEVFEGSPAEKGGLKRGDIIIKFNNTDIKDSRALQEKVGTSDPGDKVKLTIIRDGAEKDVEIKLGEMPEEVPSVSQKKEDKEVIECRGIEVSNITADLKREYNINVAQGVVVIGVDPAGECYEIGLRVGDVVSGINREEIKDVSVFEAAMKKVDFKKGVVFDVIRNGRPLYISYQKSE